MGKNRIFAIILLIILFTSGAMAKSYIEVWPDGWSDVSSLFTTSIFADRFFVVHDAHGTSFLSLDGSYFKELDLVYRLMKNGEVQEEVLLQTKGQLDDPFLGIDAEGNRHVVWLERSSEMNILNYTTIASPYTEHNPLQLYQTENTLQDLAAYQVGNTLHLVWTERDQYFQVYYGRVEQGELVLVETITDTSDLSVRPSITIDQWGNPHIAWMETSDFGVKILYSTKTAGKWLAPFTLGDGSVQDIQQGGTIALEADEEGINAAWSTLPRNSSRLYVYHGKISYQQEITPAAMLALGSKARFISTQDSLQLVWQSTGQFGAEINHGFLAKGGLNNTTNLTVGRKAAFRPEVVERDGFLYVYWLQAHPDGGYGVYSINNQYPKTITFWRKVGIDETAPFYHLLFLFMSNLMLAAVYTIMNSGLVLISGIIYSVLQRVERYRKQSLFYQISLIAIIQILVRYLPIPSGGMQFFGLIHYGLSFFLAILGTYLIFRTVRQRNLFINIALLIVWMYLFQFFGLLPQNILR